jgi:hypothetical protein
MFPPLPIAHYRRKLLSVKHFEPGVRVAGAPELSMTAGSEANGGEDRGGASWEPSGCAAVSTGQLASGACQEALGGATPADGTTKVCRQRGL